MVGPRDASTSRMLVLDITQHPTSKELRTVDMQSNKEATIVLCDEWSESSVSACHIVRVIFVKADGSYSLPSKPEDTILVTRNENLLIVHPDTLISGTHVADSFLCLRKAVLIGRVPPGSVLDSAGGEAALFGSMIHRLFQKILALDTNRRGNEAFQPESQSASVDIMEMFEAVEDILFDHLEDLYGANVSDRHARQVLHKVVPELLQWYNDFMGAGNPDAAVGVNVRDTKSTHNVVVTEVCDIEELIWSPVLGLKGKVDASVQFRRDNVDSGVGVLELKTGSSMGYAAVSHAAQVTLYTLLLSDRYCRSISNGLLSYIRYQKALQDVKAEDEKATSQGDKIALSQTRASFDDSPKNRAVTAIRGELIGLIMQRNKLAAYLRLDSPVEDLPPPIKGSENLCAKCFVSDSCLIQHKLLENGSLQSVEDGPGIDLFTQKAAHLNSLHAAYYSFWRRALAEEENYAGRLKKEIWAMRGAKREALGRCLSSLILIANDKASQPGSQEVLAPGEHLVVVFQRHPKSTLHGDFTHSGISSRDFVVVSAESVVSGSAAERETLRSTVTWQCALTNGFVQHVTSSSISVSVDRSLYAWAKNQGVAVEEISWRVDAEEIYASHTTAKRSLETLFLRDEANNFERLRGLIVDKGKPEFEKRSTGSNMELQDVLKKFNLDLNEDQDHALRMALRAKDYLLVLGMPGTGKTTTLAAVVLASAMQGKSILFCSHTNAAVDNMLCKFIELGFTDFIRLGRSMSVIDTRVHPYHVSKRCTPGLTLAQLERALSEPRVVATTCLGINHPLLARRGRFDLVVVDEASQIFQPICLGPLLFASGPFILVGDHYQLPPLARSKASKQKSSTKRPRESIERWRQVAKDSNLRAENVSSMEESLFKRLCGVHPEAMARLSKQYRMAAEIMGLSNELVYSSSLSCGTERVAAQKLEVSMDSLRFLSPWLKAVRNPSRRLVFLDSDSQNQAVEQLGPTNQTSGLGEVPKDDSVRENSKEARIVQAAIGTLVEGGVKAEEITVLSPFRAQVHLIRDMMANHQAMQEVSVFTVDQYQGKDNKCIILSLVRSNAQPVGPLLKDWRRLNVALTRAKQKLVIVGSAKTLGAGSHFLAKMIEYFKTRYLIFPAT